MNYVKAGYVCLLFSIVVCRLFLYKIEEPLYKIERIEGSLQIRQYPRVVQASIVIANNRDKAFFRGYLQLRKYINGDNSIQSNGIETDSCSKIAMTNYVGFEKKETLDLWEVVFLMPSSYELKTLPLPKNQKIILQEQESKCYAAITFPWYKSQADIAKELDKLCNYVKEKNFVVKGNPIFGYYYCPWWILALLEVRYCSDSVTPTLRCKEIMIEISNEINISNSSQ